MNGPLVIARAIHFAATLLLTGGLAFRCFVAVPVFHGKAGAAFEAHLQAHLRTRLEWMVWTALAVAVVSGAAWLVLLSGEIGGVPVAEAVIQGLPWTVLTQTTFGGAWMLRLWMAVALAALLAARRFLSNLLPGFIDLACVVLAAAFVASIAWTGHAASMEGMDGAIHLTSDALHLVAAGAWLGALWPLALLLAAAQRAGDPGSAAVAWHATRRFSMLGMISVAAILATGVVNTWEILGPAAFSLGTDYNRLLLAKVVLFAAMVAIAVFNRQRLTPRLSSGPNPGRAMRQLQWNSLTETALGLLILTIVAVIGRMTPHMHMHG
jgi:putative copper resistance protein D